MRTLEALAWVFGTMGVGMAPGCIAAYLNERKGNR